MRQSSSSSSKPISSPGNGRALFDKFPPPLMRFVRTRSSRPKSKSKSKSKATPLFFRKRKPTVETQQEPSSPKVTCIGQVRVRRARCRSHRRRNDKHRCRFAGECCCSKGFGSLWRKCVSFFCFPVRTGSRSNPVEDCDVRSRPDDVERENAKTEELGFSVASETTAPKNALMLTRCRSAPYRSSSLACRLWGQEAGETPANQTEPTVSLSNSTSETEVEDGGRESAAGIESEREEKVVVAPALMAMMRCRSEPARRGGEKLDPLTSEFWRERKRLTHTHQDNRA